VRGGTSVNAIAAEARMAIDMRSNSAEELAKLEAHVLALIKEATAEENKRWNSDKISVEMKLIGARPAGAIPDDAAIVQASRRAIGAVSRPARVTLAGSSTDSNIAMSLGIPAVTLGGGGEGGGWHSPGEWYKPTDAYLGPQHVLLTVLALAGVEGVSAPLLTVRPPR